MVFCAKHVSMVYNKQGKGVNMDIYLNLTQAITLILLGGVIGWYCTHLFYKYVTIKNIEHAHDFVLDCAQKIMCDQQKTIKKLQKEVFNDPAKNYRHSTNPYNNTSCSNSDCSEVHGKRV